jgi:hypothetical protein
MDAGEQPWTLRCRNLSFGLLRRPVVDSCGRGNSPEKRKVGGSAPPLTTHELRKRVDYDHYLTATFAFLMADRRASPPML